MSMDKPNEYEQAIEAYAEATRELGELEARADELRNKVLNATVKKRAAWTTVAKHITDGNIKPGVYRLAGRTYSEGLVLAKFLREMPPLLPMFR